MNERLPARDVAAASVCVRHHHRSTMRTPASVSRMPIASAVMTDLRTWFSESVVIAERSFAADVTLAVDRLEDVTGHHLAAVHVQRD